jgi:molybdopterin synthase catalytic subunit
MNPALVTIQTEGFDPVADSRLLDNPLAGAQASFLGLVRHDGGHLQALELEHYPGMTERAIAAMVQEAGKRFGLTGAIVRHRVGRLVVGEPIVWVLTAAPHRRAALDGCAFLIDYLKTQAPFWKKEHGASGSSWVDAREADDEALARWGVEQSNAA